MESASLFHHVHHCSSRTTGGSFNGIAYCAEPVKGSKPGITVYVACLYRADESNGPVGLMDRAPVSVMLRLPAWSTSLGQGGNRPPRPK